MRRAIYLLLVCAFICSATEKNAYGITRRDDRDDSSYQALANSTFACGGLVYFYTDPINGYVSVGSGVLISPNWILSAKHALSTTKDVNNYFQSNAGQITIAYDSVIQNASCDIALGHLSSPITSIAPTKIYNVDKYGSEIGKECYISGAGSNGTGAAGQGGIDWVRRAAQTYVMCNATSWGWDDALLTQFRRPGSGAADLEGGSCSGDSGGGLYLSAAGQWALAGIQSYSYYANNDSGASTIGCYGAGSGYIRTDTSEMRNWILTYAKDAQIVPEPSSLAILVGALFSLGGMLLRRRYAK